jgi:PHP family Zn ribbon phosphoesterase
MNRLISALDGYALISNSDCHSPAKLGREANIFATGFDYYSLSDALRQNCRTTFRGTVEFFPEEGKYHADGHDSCRICLEPAETRRAGGICPVCGKPLTVGVLHRVLELADRKEPHFPADAPEVFSLLPLVEILAELLGTGSASKAVQQHYCRAIRLFGSEFELLLRTPVAAIETVAPLLAEAIRRVREGQVNRQPGFDGRYGVIRAFAPGELATDKGRKELFAD